MGKKRQRLLAGISTNVLVLGIVSFLTDTSSEMIYPILPMFIVAIGGTGLLVGLIEGAAETTASLLKVVSGWHSDRFQRRKPFITGGYGASALVKPLLVFATSPWQVLGIRITERIGKGVRSAPRDALIADSTAPEVMGRAFGFHKSMDSLGAVLGPVLALVVMTYAAATTEVELYRLIFAIATIPAFAAVVVILAFVREREGAARPSRGGFREGIRTLERPFWTLIAITLVFYFGEISYAFFVLQAQAAGQSATETIALYVLFNIVFVVLATPSGVLSDRIGRKPVLAASFGVFAFTTVTMAVADSLWLLVMGFALYGVYKGTSEGVFKAYVTDIVPSHLRGTALGTFHMAVGLVMLPGGVVAGLLWDSVAPWATFTLGAALAFSACAMLLLFGPGRAAQSH